MVKPIAQPGLSRVVEDSHKTVESSEPIAGRLAIVNEAASRRTRFEYAGNLYANFDTVILERWTTSLVGA